MNTYTIILLIILHALTASSFVMTYKGKKHLNKAKALRDEARDVLVEAKKHLDKLNRGW